MTDKTLRAGPNGKVNDSMLAGKIYGLRPGTSEDVLLSYDTFANGMPRPSGQSQQPTICVIATGAHTYRPVTFVPIPASTSGTAMGVAAYSNADHGSLEGMPSVNGDASGIISPSDRTALLEWGAKRMGGWYSEPSGEWAKKGKSTSRASGKAAAAANELDSLAGL